MASPAAEIPGPGQTDKCLQCCEMGIYLLLLTSSIDIELFPGSCRNAEPLHMRQSRHDSANRTTQQPLLPQNSPLLSEVLSAGFMISVRASLSSSSAMERRYLVARYRWYTMLWKPSNTSMTGEARVEMFRRWMETCSCLLLSPGWAECSTITGYSSSTSSSSRGVPLVPGPGGSMILCSTGSPHTLSSHLCRPCTYLLLIHQFVGWLGNYADD